MLCRTQWIESESRYRFSRAEVRAIPFSLRVSMEGRWTEHIVATSYSWFFVAQGVTAMLGDDHFARCPAPIDKPTRGGSRAVRALVAFGRFDIRSGRANFSREGSMKTYGRRSRPRVAALLRRVLGLRWNSNRDGSALCAPALRWGDLPEPRRQVRVANGTRRDRLADGPLPTAAHAAQDEEDRNDGA